MLPHSQDQPRKSEADILSAVLRQAKKNLEQDAAREDSEHTQKILEHIDNFS